MTEEDLKLLQKKGKQTTRCYCCDDAMVVVRRILVHTVTILSDSPGASSSSFLLMKQIRSCITPFLRSVRPRSLSKKLTTLRYRS
jgi:hypothetical protein